MRSTHSVAFAVLIAAYVFNSGIAPAQETSFSVTVDSLEHGSLTLSPALPADGKYKEGTVVTVKAKADAGYELDSIYYSVPGRWGAMYHESLTPEFKITIDRDKRIGASFIKSEEVAHIDVKHDIVYAKPGVKALKYDVYSPKGAKDLPVIVIIHGGGWSTNDENIMRGLARELTKGGKFVVCSIDYRWVGNLDGDEQPNSMAHLIEDVFGAIAHITEHATKYGGDPSRIGVTGDSAGGHLSASASILNEKIGDRGFGKTEGMFEFKPTYLPEGKSADDVKKEMLTSIKAAAPSYGVFAADPLSRFQRDLSQAGAEAVAPQGHIPPISERAVPQYLLRGTRDFLIRDEAVAAFADALKEQGQRAIYEQVEGAGHAFFDWKPNAQVKATFAEYGVPYAAKMRIFFEEHLYGTVLQPDPTATPATTPDGAPLGLSPIKIEPGNQTENFFTIPNPADGRPASLPVLVYTPKDYQADRQYPLLLFLHGLGESGNGNFKQLAIHGPPKRIAKEGQHLPFVVVSPQSPKPEGGRQAVVESWKSDELMALLDNIEAHFSIDKSRVYVSGLSMGGFGAWRLVADHPDRFAAAIPICGGGKPAWAQQLKSVPIWTFHGGKDNVVSLQESEEIVTAIQRAGGDVKLTVYPEAGHDSWTETYENPAIYEWLLSHQRRD